MPTRTQLKAKGFELTALEVKEANDQKDKWVANAVLHNASKQRAVCVIPTKDRSVIHRSEDEALASVMEWIHT
ncbi:MAG: hypothetical protein V4474_00180 [Patescibacteria group bacterium]